MEEQLNPIEKQATGDTVIRYGLIPGVISILCLVTLMVTGVNITEGTGRWSGLI